MSRARIPDYQYYLADMVEKAKEYHRLAIDAAKGPWRVIRDEKHELLLVDEEGISVLHGGLNLQNKRLLAKIHDMASHMLLMAYELERAKGALECAHGSMHRILDKWEKPDECI